MIWEIRPCVCRHAWDRHPHGGPCVKCPCQGFRMVNP